MILPSGSMKNVICLLLNLLTTLAKLLRPGGGRAVIAENLLLKQQLIIHSRSRQTAPNLTTRDRALLGFMSLFLNPRRIIRAAIIISMSSNRYRMSPCPIRLSNDKLGASGVNSWIRPSSGPLLTWTTSSGITSATTISIGAIRVSMAPLLLRQIATMLSA